jgi:hypothetical protein
MYWYMCESGIVGVLGSATADVGSSRRNRSAIVARVLSHIMGGVDGRFLATSVGFHYLTEIGYIDQEIDDWFHGRNEEFVRSLEANYERSLHADDDDIERYQFYSNRVLKVVHSPESCHSTFTAN